jgi:hypothetical protein
VPFEMTGGADVILGKEPIFADSDGIMNVRND